MMDALPVLVTVVFAASHAAHACARGVRGVRRLDSCDQATRLLGMACVLHAIQGIGLHWVALAVVAPPALLAVLGCALQFGLATPAV